MKKKLPLLLTSCLFLFFSIAKAQMAGTRTIPSTNFPTIKVAIDSLNAYGVGGAGITFNITPGHYERTAGNIAILTNTASSNSIVFQKNGGGANPIITAGVGAGTRDGIIRIEGTDNVTFDGLELRDTSLNSTTTTQMENGIVCFKKSATDGSQGIVVRNCTITLNKTNTSTVAIATVNTTSGGATNIPTNAAYICSGHKYYSNTISNCYNGISMVGSTTTNFHDDNNDIGTLGGNNISNFGGSTTQVQVIFIQNGNNVVIRNNTISGGTSTNAGVYGILVSTATAVGAVGNSAKICSNNITLSSGGTTSLMAGISYAGTTGTSSVVNIDSNTFTGCSYPTATSATYQMIHVTTHPYTLTCNNNTITNNKYGATTAGVTATGQMAGITIQASNTNSGSSTTISNNNITGFNRYQVSANSGNSYMIHNSGSALTYIASNNTILNDSNNGTGDLIGIYHFTSASATVKRIFNNSIKGMVRVTGNTGQNYGINISSGAATCIDSIYNNVVANTTNAGSGNNSAIFRSYASSGLTYIYNDSMYNTGGTLTTYGLFYSNTNLSGSVVIRKNYISANCFATTSQLAGINVTSATTNVGACTLDSNSIATNYTSATSGNVYPILMNALCGTTNINNNTIETVNLGSVSTAGTGECRMIYISGSNSNTGSNLNIYNNWIKGFNRVQSAPSTGVFYGISFITTSGCAFNRIYNNLIENISNPSTSSATYGLYMSSNLSTCTNRSIYNNIFKNFARSNTNTTGVTAGIYTDLGAAAVVDSIYGNVIKNFTNLGTGTVYGMYHSPVVANKYIALDSVYGFAGNLASLFGIYQTSGTTATYSRNMVFDLASTNTAASTNGIYVIGGTTVNVMNNRVADLRATATSNLLALAGISVQGGTTVRVLYNTVHLNGSSTGTNFGTSAIYAATGTVLDLRNNILYNNSTPAGTGTTVSYRRSGVTLTNYRDSSDNNIYYAGTPGTARLLFSDGVNLLQTIPTLSAFMRTTTGVNRDRFSQTENVDFLSTSGLSSNFLRLNPTTSSYAEGGATNISFLTADDAEATNIRTGYPLGGQSNGGGAQPDIGADEYDGTPKTAMSYNTTTVANATTYSSARSARNQQIIKMVVNTTGSYTPLSATRFTFNPNGTDDLADLVLDSTKIFYTGSSSTFDSLQRIATGTAVGGQYGINSNFKLATGDNVFWLTYDIQPTATLNDTLDAELDSIYVGGTGYAIGGAVSGERIIRGPMCGTYTVGSGYNFNTITQAFSELMLRGVDTFCTSRVILELKDADYSSSETFPLYLLPISGAANDGRSIVMRPGAGVTSTITGANYNSLFILGGTDYFTLDGSNSGGTDRSLTLLNNQDDATTPQAYDVIRLLSLGANAGCLKDTIKNCTIKSFSGVWPTSSQLGTTYGISLSGSATVTANTLGYDNDSIAILNNAISKVHTAIQVFNSSVVNACDQLSIQNNTIGNSAGSDAMLRSGITLSYCNGATVSNNDISGLRQYSWVVTPVGIDISTGVVNSNFRNNVLHRMGFDQTNLNQFGCVGIRLNTGTASSNDTLANNVMYDLLGTGSTTPGASITGINVTSASSGFAIYNNSINMTGSIGRSGGSIDTNACLWINSASVSNIDVRNNSFMNSLVNTANSGARSFSIVSWIPAAAFAVTTNNNDYYASGSQGVLGQLSGAQTTIGAWKTAMGANRDSISVSGDPLYNSSSNLTPLPGSPLANAGAPLSSVVTDIEGTSRSLTTPTIGAFETVRDVVPPTITFTPITNTSVTGDRTLTAFATVNDLVSNPVKNVRLYYKKSTDDNTYVGNTSSDNGWKYVNASNGSSPFNFTIDTSIVNGGALTVGDEIQYFVVAEDSITVPNANVGINSGTFAVTPDSSLLTSAAFPITGTINSYFISNPISGSFVVDSSGSGGAFRSLTGATGLFKYLNENVIGGDITATVQSHLVEDGTHALNALSYSGGSYLVRIVPSAATNYSISGAVANAMIRFNGGDNATIDGSFGGSGRYFTFKNTNTSNATFAFVNDATFDSISNCNIQGSNTNNNPSPSGTVAANGTIYIGTGAATGNDNLTFYNDIITNISSSLYSTVGIYTEGASSINSDDVTINSCEIGNFRDYGIYAFGTSVGDDWDISNNSIYNGLTGITTSQFAIRYEPGGAGGTIKVNNNFIGGSAANCGGSAWSNGVNNGVFNGIRISLGNTDTSEIQGNVIKNISGTNSSTGMQVVGLFVTNTGIYKVGTTAGNTFGDTTAAGSIITAGLQTTSGMIVQTSVYAEVANNYVTSFSNTNNGGGGFTGIDCRNGSFEFHDNVVGSLSATARITNNGTGTITGFATSPLRNYTSNMYNNVVSGITESFTSGPFIGINCSNTGNVNIHHNRVGSDVTNGVINLSGASQHSGIQSTNSGTGQYYNNQVSGISSSSTGSATIIGLFMAGNEAGNVFNNTVGSSSLTNAINIAGTGTFYGLYQSHSNDSALSFNNNLVSNITRTNAGTYSTFGLINSVTASILPVDIDSNTIDKFTSSGQETFIGISSGGSSLSQQSITNNTIMGLTHTSTGTASFTGITVSGTSANPMIANNLIGSNTVNGSITLTGTGAITGIVSTASGAPSFLNNQISGITQTNSSNASSCNGISFTGAIGGVCNNNIIGSATLTNSLSIAGSGFWTLLNQSNPSALTAAPFNNNLMANITRTFSGTTNTTGINNATVAITSPLDIDSNTIRNYTSSGNENFIGITTTGNANTNVNLTNNTLKAISITGTGTGSFTGINLSSGQAIIGGSGSGNTIGDVSTSNDIAVATNGVSIALNATPSDSTYITYNSINNITASNSGASAAARGIAVSGAAILDVSNNSIKNMTSAGALTTALPATAHGIASTTTNTGCTFNANTINGLYATHSSAATFTVGLSQANTGGGNFTKNRIYNLENMSATGTMAGFYQSLGTVNLSNNQVSITNGANTNDNAIYGLYMTAGTSQNNYYNSVYIGGTVASGSLNSSAVYRNTTSTNNVVNNIFFNKRTGGSGNHVGGFYSSVTNLSANYNLYVSSSPSNALVRLSATNYTLNGWKAQNRDSSSWGDSAATVNSDSLFVNAAAGNLSINPGTRAAWYSNGKGIAGVASGNIATDFNSDSRGTTLGFGTDLGSDEFTVTSTPIPAIQTGNIANNDSTTYTFAGRVIARIKWRNSTSFYGTSFPTSITALYYSGETPPDPTNGGNNPSAEYMNGYWVLNQTGGTHYLYDVSLLYDDALLGSISSESNMKLSKKPAVSGTGDWKAHFGSEVNTTANVVRFTDLNGFSVFTPSTTTAPLLFNLSTFTAMPSDKNAQLNWQSVSEMNSSHINILRSMDGIAFERIATVKAIGNAISPTDYAYTDVNVADLQTALPIYYQLEMVDEMGLKQLSDIRQVNFKKSFSITSVYPQPANDELNVSLSLTEDAFVTISLLDMNGKTIYTNANEYKKGASLATINTSEIAAGLYLVKIDNGSDVIVTKVFKK